MSTVFRSTLLGMLMVFSVGPAHNGQAAPIRGAIHPSVDRLFVSGDADERVKVWILFDPNDKGVASHQAQEQAIAQLRATYNLKAKTRRQLRRTAPGLFDVHDLPVVPRYVDQIRATGAEVKVISCWLNGVSALVTRGQLADLGRLPFVDRIQPVRRGRAIDPVAVGQDHAPPATNATGGPPPFWGAATGQLSQINLTAVHDLGFTAAGVVVGILDTGFKRTHDAFNVPGHVVNVVAEWDFVNNDPNTSLEMGDPPNQHSHGTYILGVLGAYSPGSLVGGAYDASFVLCKTEDTTGEYMGEEDNYVGGLEFIEANGGDMATSSLGYIDWYTQGDLDGLTAVTTIAVNIATANGLYCCTAAGNGGHDADPATSALLAPADALQVISCGAVDDLGVIASFSSDGPTADGRLKPEVLAQGVNTQTVSPSDDTLLTGVSGTSLSTPVVASAVACLIQAHPDWTVEQMRTYLFANASESAAGNGPDPMFVLGYGIVDALGALAADCDGNGIADSADIAAGTLPDCNANGIPDGCDIAFGNTADADGNGVPDVCDSQGTIPAVSQWGVVVMALLVLAAGSIFFPRRRRVRG